MRELNLADWHLKRLISHRTLKTPRAIAATDWREIVAT
jgi:hypothetical protein